MTCCGSQHCMKQQPTCGIHGPSFVGPGYTAPILVTDENLPKSEKRQYFGGILSPTPRRSQKVTTKVWQLRPNTLYSAPVQKVRRSARTPRMSLMFRSVY